MIYGIENAKDMLAKLGREIARLERAIAKPDNKNEVGDFAINCFLTAWHICEWHLADHSKNDDEARRFLEAAYKIPRTEQPKESEKSKQKQKKTKPLTALQKELIKECEELQLCQVIANMAKHVRITFGVPKEIVDSIKADTSLSASSPINLTSLITHNSPEEAAATVQMPYHPPKVYINDVPTPAIDVLREVQGFWKGELERVSNLLNVRH